MSIVPDASVAVKWLFEEADSAAAVALLHTERAFCAPDFLRVEVAAAIVRRFRTGGLSREDAKERAAHAAQLLSETRVRYIADARLLASATQMALRLKHNLQDCLYLACAHAQKAELVTADPTFLKRAKPHYDFVRPL